MEYIIGLDIGTSSTKAVAFDLKGKVIAENSNGYPILNPQPAYFEQDPEVIFQAVVKSIAMLADAEALNAAKGTLKGISFSSAMHSLIAVNEKGNPLTNNLIWADNRSREQADRIRNSKEGHDIYMKTGTPIHPMSPLCKLVWLRENKPAIFKNAYKFISIKEYVFFKLFGQYIIDHSIASATGLFNIYTHEWHSPALAVADVTQQQLSAPVPITNIQVGLSQAMADSMKIDPETPFIIGGSDGCLANLGANAVKPGDAAVTIGTSGAIRVIANKPKNDTKERIFSYMLTSDIYVLGGAVNSGGGTLKWFKDNFATSETEEAAQKSMDIYDLLTEKAAVVPPGSEGLVFLPYLMGERAPHWNAQAKGVFFGVALLHSKAHFIRAVMEGIIYGIYSVGKALEETTGEINIIHANGGFAKSPLWVQILADVFNKQVMVTESIEGSALGAAIVGMKALDIIDSFEEVGDLVPIKGTYTPNLQNHYTYRESFALFERLYDRLKDEFEHNN